MSEVLPPERFEPDRLLQALIEADVRFVLIGGLAVGVHGYVRATQDLDIVPDPEAGNLERLAAVLQELGARQIGVDTELLPNQPSDPAGLAAGGSYQLATEHGQLDILQESDVIPGYPTLTEDAIEIEWRSLRVRVCSLARLLAMKRASGRRRDLADVEALEDAHGD